VGEEVGEVDEAGNVAFEALELALELIDDDLVDDRGTETEPPGVDVKLNVDEVGFEIIGKC